MMQNGYFYLWVENVFYRNMIKQGYLNYCIMKCKELVISPSLKHFIMICFSEMGLWCCD